jgi:hypothetical protein
MGNKLPTIDKSQCYKVVDPKHPNFGHQVKFINGKWVLMARMGVPSPTITFEASQIGLDKRYNDYNENCTKLKKMTPKELGELGELVEIHKHNRNILQQKIITTGTQMTCGDCGSTNNDVQKCSDCKVQYYCNKNCQVSHWSLHKDQCKEIKKHIKKRIKIAQHDDTLFDKYMWNYDDMIISQIINGIIPHIKDIFDCSIYSDVSNCGTLMQYIQVPKNDSRYHELMESILFPLGLTIVKANIGVVHCYDKEHPKSTDKKTAITKLANKLAEKPNLVFMILFN